MASSFKTTTRGQDIRKAENTVREKEKTQSEKEWRSGRHREQQGYKENERLSGEPVESLE